MRFLLKSPTPQKTASEENPIALPEGVKIRHSPRAKRLALRLDKKDNMFALVIPPRTSLRRAHSFVWMYEDWVANELAKLPPVIKLEHGAVISILGVPTVIDVEYDQNRKTTTLSLIKNPTQQRLRIKTNKTDPAPRITRYLKKTAKEELLITAHAKAALIRKKIKNVRVRDTVSRWGSCTSDGSLSFSWRLIFAPRNAFDYVVAHEVAHLRHMDHSRKFWSLCESLCEDYKGGKTWMRQNGHILHTYK